MEKINSLVTIVVPVYNVEKYLRKCLNSIVNQIYENIEIICVDDGSPDNSINILNEFAQSDKRVKIIRQENQGLSGARNTGINNAIGKYIMFIDSDDWIELNMVELMVNKIENENLDLVVCGNTNYYVNKIKKQELTKLSSEIIYSGIDYFRQNYKKNYRFGNCWNKIYKLDLIKQKSIKFPIKRLYEDLLFVFQYIYFCKKVGIIKQSLYNYVISRDGAITNKINRDDLKDTLFTLEEIKKFLKLENDYKLLNSIEFSEYMFFWILRNSLFKFFLNNKYNQKEVGKIIKELKESKEYKEIAKYILRNSKNIKYKIFIIALYFNEKIVEFLIRLNYYKNELKGQK